MEKIAKTIAYNIAVSLGYNEEKQNVIAYGITALIQIFVTVCLVLLFGNVLHTAAECIIICFSVSFLRKYSGGAHAVSAELCTVITVICCGVFSIISKYLLAYICNFYIMILLIVMVYGFSFFAIHRFAPVDCPNKPIKSEKKKIRMKKGSNIVLLVYFLMSIILLLLGYDKPDINSLGISLLLGIMWQIFTLTKLGSLFLNNINFVLNKIK